MFRLTFEPNRIKEFTDAEEILDGKLLHFVVAEFILDEINFNRFPGQRPNLP